jgi:hypothetical protein
MKSVIIYLGILILIQLVRIDPTFRKIVVSKSEKCSTLPLSTNESLFSSRTNSASNTLKYEPSSKLHLPSNLLMNIPSDLKMLLVAGQATTGTAGNGVPATSASINPGIPWVDLIGNIYIPDGSYNIRRIETNGILSTFGGTGTSSSSGIGGPITSVSFGYLGSIVGDTMGTFFYVSDSAYVWKYLFASGNVSVVVSSAGLGSGSSGDNGPATSAKVCGPQGLWLTTSNVLYIADTGNHRIRKVLPNGIINTVVGRGLCGQTGGFFGDGGPVTSADISDPLGVYVDSVGKIFIADSSNNRIRFIDTNNIISTFAGAGTDINDNVPAFSAYVNFPYDVKGDSLGNIYIADNGNFVVRVVDVNGIISTLFGKMGSQGFTSGLSSRSSKINRPRGIWLDTLATIYFSDPNAIYRGIIASNPTSQPSRQPTSQPTRQPVLRPSAQPSRMPSSQPTTRPSRQPSSQPSLQPFSFPSSKPSCSPSIQPTAMPTIQPSSLPTVPPSNLPSAHPSQQPSALPSVQPSVQPSGRPTRQPSSSPSSQPTVVPSDQPSLHPSRQPSAEPTARPSRLPSSQPSRRPTANPTRQPSNCPSAQPTSSPSNHPSRIPSRQPSSCPTNQPSSYPTAQPLSRPTGNPTGQPSFQPATVPSSQPTSSPSKFPSSFPTRQPTSFPSAQPSVHPSRCPSSQPSSFPSVLPTSCPTILPTCLPSGKPTSQPTSVPSCHPISIPTNEPSTSPTMVPSSQPSIFPTIQPTNFPSSVPTLQPTVQPTIFPTNRPTIFPSSQPTRIPSAQPSRKPSNQPSPIPSAFPSSFPSFIPASRPSSKPSIAPSTQPTSIPSYSSSSQPTFRPSKQPNSFPTSKPTQQPTSIPTAQPFAYPTAAPQATIYQTNSVLFYLGTSDSNSTKSDSSSFLGSSYVLFGRNYNHQSRFPSTIALSSSSSREFVSEINKHEGGIRSDLTTRSTTIIGDINGDGYVDLLVGFPLASKCSVYLGNGNDDFATIVMEGESFAIIGDPYDGGGFLGWSSIRIGDVNDDGFDEIVVSAIYANTVYVIYGRKKFGKNNKNININELTANDGFRITGSHDDINFGVSLALVHRFSNHGSRDIAFTAEKALGGQNIVYILFSAEIFNNNTDIQVMNDPSSCFKIITPVFSYAGFSLAGIGDINNDDFDDLAIGSLPYSRGTFNSQKTYIIYGREINQNNNNNELLLEGLNDNDGFVITGGGFLVAGVGDLNYDGVADVMISSYDQWQENGNSYLIVSPKNITCYPSVQPSSHPTIRFTSSSPSFLFTFNESAVSNASTTPTLSPTLRPTRFFSSNPSINPTTEPTRIVFSKGTTRPSVKKPTLRPSTTPTTGYHRLRGTITETPSQNPSMLPTIHATTDYIEIDCSKGGIYNAVNESNFKFLIRTNKDSIQLTGNDDGEAKNLYILYSCPSDRVNVAITNFRLSTDMISVAHLSEGGSGYSYPSLNKISYSLKSGSLTLLFCSENKLQVILTSHTSFDLKESNFLFSLGFRNEESENITDTALAFSQVGIVLAVFLLLLSIYGVLSHHNNEKDKDKSALEEELLAASVEMNSEPILQKNKSGDDENDSSGLSSIFKDDYSIEKSSSLSYSSMKSRSSQLSSLLSDQLFQFSEEEEGHSARNHDKEEDDDGHYNSDMEFLFTLLGRSSPQTIGNGIQTVEMEEEDDDSLDFGLDDDDSDENGFD